MTDEHADRPTDSAGPERRERPWIGWFLGVAAIPLGLFLLFLAGSYLTSDDPNPSSYAFRALLGVAEAERIFRRTDLNRNGVKDYWTGNVRGLHALRQEDGTAIALIPRAVARADYAADRGGRSDRRSFHGYYLAAFRRTPTGDRYQRDPDGDGRASEHRSKYAFMAFPAAYGEPGTKAFIVNQTGSIWRVDARSGGYNGPTGKPASPPGTPPVEQFPADPADEGYTRIYRPNADVRTGVGF